MCRKRTVQSPRAVSAIPTTSPRIAVVTNTRSPCHLMVPLCRTRRTWCVASYHGSSTADVGRQTDQWPVKMKIGKMENSHWCYQIPWRGAPCLHQRLDLRQGMLIVSCGADRSDVAVRDLESDVHRHPNVAVGLTRTDYAAMARSMRYSNSSTNLAPGSVTKSQTNSVARQGRL